jgi:hypothetical protein
MVVEVTVYVEGEVDEVLWEGTLEYSTARVWKYRTKKSEKW